MDILLCLQNKIKEINDMNDNRNNYSWSSQCHRRNTRFHFRFGEEWVIRIQSDRANQYVGTDTMCNYHADKIADSKNAKGGGMTQKNDWNKTDSDYWRDKGWLNGKKPYYGK